MSTISASTTSTTAYKVTADTTGTLVLQTGATPTTAVTIGSDQSTTLAGTLNLAGQNMTPYTGFKNRIINGAMVIDQRNAGASVTLTGSNWITDRFNIARDTAGVSATAQQSSTVPASATFAKSLGISVATGAAAGASDDNFIYNTIEGLNFSDMGFGTAAAQSFTISFWVRSSVTGTYGLSLSNSAANRCYMATYTVNSANTWEQKTVTIVGDTSGTWLATNGIGLRIIFDLGCGSSRSIAASSGWGASYGTGLTGGVKLFANTGATFYITGVQLEKGSTATSFDYRPYGTELALCQRYYWYIGGEQAYAPVTVAYWASTTDAYGVVTNPVTMRTAPTIAKTGNLVSFQTGTFGTFASTQITSQVAMVGWTGGSGGTQGYSTILRANNDTTMRVTFSAEL